MVYFITRHSSFLVLVSHSLVLGLSYVGNPIAFLLAEEGSANLRSHHTLGG